jgi:1-deoxy-D-xylulose-5-phosphate reductoisomerase
VTGVAILGSTGSIGTTTLSVLRRHPGRFRVAALVAGSNVSALREQVAEWRPPFAGVVRANGDAHGLGQGPSTLVEAATRDDVGIVVNAVVGAAGLDATLAALEAGKRVALANKESLVMAGPLVLAAARRGGGEIVPIDSEHSAVLQCITRQEAEVRRVILTASGGPFRTWDAARVATATVEDALKHPTWSMGAKITVDSATLANKALEVIEAHHLFGLPYEDIDVVLHPQSIVHAFVEFRDGNFLAQVGVPSMEGPILYALSHPERFEDSGAPPFRPEQAPPLTFEPVEGGRFPAFDLGVAAGRAGGTAPAAFNAANEVAVAAFLARRIPFGRIHEVIGHALDRHAAARGEALEEVRAADAAARTHAEEAI